MTLPEVLIATMVLGTALSAFVTGFVAHQKTIVYANNRLAALHAARDVVERLGTNRYDSAPLSAGTHILGNGSYVVSASNNIKDVVVTIRWVDPTRRLSNTVSLATSFCEAVHKQGLP